MRVAGIHSRALKMKYLPKVVLHTHLEGSIPVSAIKRFRNKYGVPFPCDLRPREMCRQCRIAGWTGFKAIFRAMVSCLRTSEDVAQAVALYGHKLAKENVRYAEVHVSPWKHVVRGIGLNAIRDSLLAGLALLSDEKLTLRFIIDILRHPSEDLVATQKWMDRLPRGVFVGVGISGGPGSVPRARYKTFCDNSKAMGYPVVAHAGELEGSASVVEAIELLGVRRICHGVNAAREPSLMSRLRDSGVHCELCPTANETLGVEEPGLACVARMITSGISCSVNPDDETIFDTDTTGELVRLLQEGIISIREASTLQRNAVRASFAPGWLKDELLAELSQAWTAAS